MIDPAARRLALARETADKLDFGVRKAWTLGFIREQATEIIAAALDQYGDALARAIREEDAKLLEDEAEVLPGGSAFDASETILRRLATAIRALSGASEHNQKQ